MARSLEKDEFKEEVKAWLKNHNADYSWLAEQCGVSENTVRNWMAKAPIPPLKQRLISRLITQLPGQRARGVHTLINVSPEIQITLKMPPETYDNLALVAQKKGIDVPGLINDAISSLVAQSDGGAGMLRNRKMVLPPALPPQQEEP